MDAVTQKIGQSRIDRALDTALITAPEACDKRLLRKLDAVAGRVLKTKR